MLKRLESTRLHTALILALFAVLVFLVLIQLPGNTTGPQLSQGWIIGVLAAVILLLLYVGRRYHLLHIDELNHREERFRSTFEQAAVGIAHVSTTGQFLTINNRFCEIVGYSQEEMLERTFQDITHPDDLETDLAHVQDLLDGKSLTYSIEKRYFHKDGEIVWVNLTVSLLRDERGLPRWFVSVVEDITARKMAEMSVSVYQKRLQNLVAVQGQAAEKERTRIAEALHDGAVQNLASALMQLDSLDSSLTAPEQERRLQETSRLLRQCILEINSMSAELNPPSLSELGLAAAINEWMAENITRHADTQAELVDLRDEDNAEDFDEVVWHLLFRNVRALLMNAVNHASATRIRVFLRQVRGNLVVEVNDNGVGCIPEDALRRSGGGLGLFAIRECMNELGGALKIDSVTGHGFSATMILPVPTNEPAVHSSERMAH